MPCMALSALGVRLCEFTAIKTSLSLFLLCVNFCLHVVKILDEITEWELHLNIKCAVGGWGGVGISGGYEESLL